MPRKFSPNCFALEIYSKSLMKLFQNKRTESLEIMNSLRNHHNTEIASKINDSKKLFKNAENTFEN